MRKSKFFLALIALIAIYIIITFSIPPDPKSLARYDLSVLESRLLSLTIVVPVIAIWSAAFYGFIRLRNYVRLIKNTPDGGPLGTISNGLTVLAFSLPVGSIVSSLLTYLSRQSPELLPRTIIITQYLSLGLLVLAFVTIERGASGLVAITKKKQTLASKIPIILILSLMAIAYIYVVLNNEYRSVPNPESGRATYFLPDWLLFSTIVIPYIFVWFKGLLAAHYLVQYQHAAQGVIYKKFLSIFSRGILVIIGTSVFIQFLGNASAALASLKLAPLLALIYFLLIIMAWGYMLIAKSARQLQKIEEV